MKNKERYGLPEIYKLFKSKFTKEEKMSSGFIDYKIFSAVIKEFNQELAKMIIEEAIEFKMPLRLGYVRIRKFRKKIKLNEDGSIDKKNLIINWKATKQQWNELYPGKDYTKLRSIPELKDIPDKPLVYHLNEHTDGCTFGLYWSKKGSNAKNRSVYSMLFTSVNNKRLAEVIKSERKVDYCE